MIPDYQTLMRPVLEAASNGERHVRDVVSELADQLGLSAEERTALLPSGSQFTFASRVGWARTYLKQAGLLDSNRRGRFHITARGRSALSSGRKIDNSYLEQFQEFQDFRERSRTPPRGVEQPDTTALAPEVTPDEALRLAYRTITEAVVTDLLDRVRRMSPAAFESLIVTLLLAMGYGGSSEDAGRAVGKSGDDGVDGVIDQDPLGVDQIYLQAKRYAEGNAVSASAIRDFYGGLGLKRASKSIFVTTSTFTLSAEQTARDLGSRIVLIDGAHLARLMIRYSIGCRDEEVLHIKKIDEAFFETD